MTRNISNQQLLESLQWRYAVKQFDPAKKISDADWSTLEQALILTPSSYGLQPWKFFVVTDQPIRDSLVEHSWRQRQVADCSHLVVIAIRKRITHKYIDDFITSVTTLRGIDRDSLSGYQKMMVGHVVEGFDDTEAAHWAKLQAYIALGNLMTCAAVMGIDACPMEGFVAERYDEILGLAQQGLTTAVLCTLGYRADTDKYAQLPKVRFEKDEVIEYI